LDIQGTFPRSCKELADSGDKNKHKYDSAGKNVYVHDSRETYVLKEIQAYISTHPKSKVALIF
jgi:hypothetical protein